ncbi:hypothetical protein C0991_002185 [Blastosporella zonata]|nr:hypothetical protein C0991_002185 [Blastosporella zonata]
MTNFKGIFLQGLAHRNELYKEADTHHEDTFSKANAEREAVFSQGQQGRADAFKYDQEARAKSSEWNSTARRTLLQKGHRRLEDTCTAIDAALVEQFNTLLKSQEDEFVADERRRDNLASKHLDKLKMAESSDSTVTIEMSEPALPSSSRSPPGSPFILGPAIPAPYPPVLIIPPNSRSSPIELCRSRIYLSRHSSPELQQEPSPGPQPRAISPRLVQLDVVIPERSNSTSSKPESSPSVEDPFDKLFTASQNERHNTFLHEEKERERRFKEVEAERDAAASERVQIFDRKAGDWSKTSNRALESHEKRFRGREEARSDRDRRRDGAFKTAQEHRSQVFDMCLAHIEKQAEAEEKFEELFIERQKSVTKTLLARQASQLEAAKKSREHRFKIAQQRRNLESGLHQPLIDPPYGINSTRPPPNIYSKRYQESAIPISRPGHTSVPVIVQGSLPEGQRRSDQYDRYFESRYSKYPIIIPVQVRPSSPGIGFSPSALVRGTNVHASLPVARFEAIEAVLTELGQELTFVNFERKRQAVFERSEVRREEAFERDTQRRRHIFKTSEAKRAVEFVKTQHRRAEMFEEAEDFHETVFQEDQRRREMSFQAAEQTREADFERSENARDTEFRRVQEEQGRRFHAMQLDIQNRSFDNEQWRFSQLENWGENLVAEREKEQRTLFRYERETFDAEAFLPDSRDL